MNDYTAPSVSDLGHLEALTGLFGSSAQPDVLVNPQGQVVLTGSGSLDACPTQNPTLGGSCTFNP